MKRSTDIPSPPFKITDKLAMERTKLANERTLLAYFRTFVVMLSSGVAILKIDFLQDLRFLGIAFLIVSPLLMIIGIARFYYVKQKILKLMNNRELG